MSLIALLDPSIIPPSLYAPPEPQPKPKRKKLPRRNPAISRYVLALTGRYEFTSKDFAAATGMGRAQAHTSIIRQVKAGAIEEVRRVITGSGRPVVVFRFVVGVAK